MKRATICPHCGKGHTDVASIATPAVPSDGDITLCIRCGEWSVFSSESIGSLRKPNREETEWIKEDERCQLATEAWLAVKEATS